MNSTRHRELRIVANLKQGQAGFVLDAGRKLAWWVYFGFCASDNSFFRLLKSCASFRHSRK